MRARSGDIPPYLSGGGTHVDCPAPTTLNPMSASRVDYSLDDADDLPEPEELVTDAIEELDAAVADLNKVLALLENGNGSAAAAKGVGA